MKACFSDKIMKPILPSLREKKRYIAYEIVSEKPLKRDTHLRGVNDGLMRFLGHLGGAKAGIMRIKDKSNKGILRVNNTMVDAVKTGLSLIKNIDGNKVLIKTTRVSGTLSNLKGG